jgi:hypothetical protein
METLGTAAAERDGRPGAAVQVIDLVYKRFVTQPGWRGTARGGGIAKSELFLVEICAGLRLVRPYSCLSLKRIVNTKLRAQDALSFAHEATSRDIKEKAPGKCHE